MIYSFELTIFLYLFLASAFWILRSFGAHTAALVLLCTSNLLLIFSAGFLLSIYLFGQFALILLLYLIIRHTSWGRQGFWPWLSFVGLLPFNYALYFGDSISTMEFFKQTEHFKSAQVAWTIGSTFFVIKSFLVLKAAIKAKRFPFLSGLITLTFIPAFPAGPIHGPAVWQLQKMKRTLTAKDYMVFVTGLGWGAAMFFILAPFTKGLMGHFEHPVLSHVTNMYLNLIALYFDFAGYSLIAICLGLLFGAELPRNFNRPYLATSIQNFWQRWHMSLSAFIGTYLFKPFVRKTGSQRWGIFLAFVCAGLWHEFSVAYLLWGIGHGYALSINKRPPAWWSQLIGIFPPFIGKIIAWFMTMSWVALLSYTATVLINF